MGGQIMGEWLRRIPEFSTELQQRCAKTSNYRPLLFELYKHTGIICIQIINLLPPSSIDPIKYAVIAGLLNRCARLMGSNLALMTQNSFGETTQLIDRCIAESSITVQWLITKTTMDFYNRFMADSLKYDHMLKTDIEKRIQERATDPWVIEKRMLQSIENCRSLTGLTWSEISSIKRLPDLQCRMSDLGRKEEYLAIQRMGSHAIHGSWTDLAIHYLTYSDGCWGLRDQDVPTRHNQFVYIILLVTDALMGYLKDFLPRSEFTQEGAAHIELLRHRVMEIDSQYQPDDFSEDAEGC
jgi:hypothetical protein